MDETPVAEGSAPVQPAAAAGDPRRRARVAAVITVVAVVTVGVLAAVWVGGGSPTGTAATSARGDGQEHRASTAAITVPPAGPGDSRDAGALSTTAPGSGSSGSGPFVPGPLGPGSSVPDPPGPGTSSSGPSSSDLSSSGGEPAAGAATGAGTVPLDPVTVGRTVRLGEDVEARVDSVSAVRVQPIGPGDVAGPGAAVVVRLRSRAAQPIDLAGLAVTATDASGAPVIPSDGEPSDVLTGRLSPGQERTGTYVFGLRAGAGASGRASPASARPALRVQVSLATAREVAVVTS